VRTLLYDPQTAGGLLISVAADQGAALLDALCQKGLPAAKIGRVLAARSDADGGPAIILR
jgi:selenide, water dikinase